MAKTSPAQFVREVRQEASKVVWPTRQETLMSSLVVCVLSFIASVFFLASDAIIAQVVKFILNLGA